MISLPVSGVSEFPARSFNFPNVSSCGWRLISIPRDALFPAFRTLEEHGGI